MRKFATLLVLAGIISCSKKDITESISSGTYQIRIAAVDNNGAKSFTPISKVKSGKVAVEYETADVFDVKEYQIEVSMDGINFSNMKTIPADLSNPNKFYRDTVILE